MTDRAPEENSGDERDEAAPQRPGPEPEPEPRVIGTSRSVRRERLRPAELVVFALVLAVFVGIIVLVTLREPLYALIGFGVTFIVSLIGLAMFALGVRPSEEELRDLREQDEGH